MVRGSKMHSRIEGIELENALFGRQGLESALKKKIGLENALSDG
jgi:hypothetical protein